MDNIKDFFKDFPSSFKNYLKNYWWKFLIISAVLVLDILTKILIVPSDSSLWQEVVLIPEILTITPTKNLGAGFSILSGKTWLLITITILFLIVFSIFDFSYKKKSKLFGISTALIMSGALGNLIDRIAFGYVRDFIYFKFINFPVFNVADIAITIGITLFVIYILFFISKNEKPNQKQETILGYAHQSEIEDKEFDDKKNVVENKKEE